MALIHGHTVYIAKSNTYEKPDQSIASINSM